MIFLVFCLSLLSSAHAISEKNYETGYQTLVEPFLKSGERFQFKNPDDQLVLEGVKFIHPQEKALLVVLNGQGETMLKYAEVFYDLFQKGYSIYSYDHRGQGLSPHLSPRNSQIGHVDHFIQYVFDLNAFMETVLKPAHPHTPVHLLAHSMGGAIATEYLEIYPSTFQSVVLSAPMLRINTSPYPEKVARAIVAIAKGIGLGKRYALGKHDYDCNGSFEANIFTGSPERWWMNNLICKNHPEALIGGPSSGWVNASLKETKRIRANASAVAIPVLLLQAGMDQLVVNSAQNTSCESMGKCEIAEFPESQHEILMERDFIRNSAIEKMDRFFQEN